ncbi:MAG: ABC transporter permease [Planctomycetota bacterium]
MVSRPARTLTAILGIAVGISTVLSVLIVDHNTILTEMSRRPSFDPKLDLVIRPLEAGATGTGAPRELLEDPDLIHASPVFFSRIRVPGPPGSPDSAEDLELVALDRNAGVEFQAYELEEGSTFSGNDASEVLLPEALAAELGVAVGDSLALQRALPAVHECRQGQMVEVQGGAGQRRTGAFCRHRFAEAVEPGAAQSRPGALCPGA